MSPQTVTEARIAPRWRALIRFVWVGLALVLLVLHGQGLGPRQAELQQVCSSASCPVLSLTLEEIDLLSQYDLSLVQYSGFHLVMEGYLILQFLGLGAFIFWKRSDTWLGFVVSLALVFIGTLFFGEEIRSLTRVRPGTESWVQFLTAISVVLMLTLFYIFPDGQFRPNWMRWSAASIFGLIILDVLVLETEAQASSTSLFIILLFITGVILGVYSQVFRFLRVSSATQRQQTKWIMLGFISMFAGMMPWAIFVEIAPLPYGMPRLWFSLSLVPQYILIGFFPMSLVVAMMRYKLWDIDLVIRRTLQYGLLTGLLALTYFGGVVIFQGIIEPLTGSASTPFVTVATTLFIAALFNPLRKRVQEFIDQRFYRAKYDAEQALDAFAAAARAEVDIHRLSGALLGTVNRTIQPKSASLWLQKSATQPKGSEH
jgi:hypothetical protein